MMRPDPRTRREPSRFSEPSGRPCFELSEYALRLYIVRYDNNMDVV
jgi:hypothetical protein